MMRRASFQRSAGFIAGVGAALVLCNGCTALLVAGAGAAGAAGYAYLNGELEKSYPASVGQCWTAVVEAVQELGMPITAHAVDELGGYVESRTAEGKKVTIRLVARPNMTTVKVRVGVFGDQQRSLAILDCIDQKIGANLPNPGNASARPNPSNRSNL
jgi:tetrahydromethanopterin S-methyltransferase subunit F